MGSEKDKAVLSTEIYGLKLPFYIILCVAVWIVVLTGNLPKDGYATCVFLISVAVTLQFIGNKIPFLNKYCAMGTILPLFGSAALVSIGLISPELKEQCSGFVNNSLVPFQMGALIAGSIIGSMDRNALKKAVLRFLPVIIGGQICAIAVAFFVGKILGTSVLDSVFSVAFPCMAGGSGGALINVPTIVGSAIGKEPGELSGYMVAALSLANVEAILACVVLDLIGKKKTKWTGNGTLVAVGNAEVLTEEKRLPSSNNYKQIATGFFFAGTLYVVSTMIAKYFTLMKLHYVVWLVLLAIIMKIANVFSKDMEDACRYWGNMLLPISLPVLLAGLGIGSIDLIAVAAALNGKFLILVTSTVLGFILGSMLVGKMVGFFPIEAGIAVGCCSVNIGGTGDLICCETAKRMELFPFAAMSTRLGGAIALLELSMLLNMMRI